MSIKELSGFFSMRAKKEEKVHKINGPRLNEEKVSHRITLILIFRENFIREGFSGN